MTSLTVGWMGQQPRGQSRDKADRELGVSSGVKVGDRDRASVPSGLPFLSASLPTSASQTLDRPDKGPQAGRPQISHEQDNRAERMPVTLTDGSSPRKEECAGLSEEDRNSIQP